MFGTDEIEIKLLEPYKKTYKIRGNLRTIKKNKHTSMSKVFFIDLLHLVVPIVIIMGTLSLIVFLLSVFI
tara:strand:+ start:776 stop:985 length:210 start_codon:yes stop_codon:yes gene_type:complete